MLIQREEYLNKLIALKDKKIIKVVTGVRRCGKSKLLEMYRKWLLEQGVEEERIVSINFEDLDFEDLTDYKKLHTYLKEHLVKDNMTYIFLDEIQNVEQFPKVVDSLYIKDNVDIFITLQAHFTSKMSVNSVIAKVSFRTNTLKAASKQNSKPPLSQMTKPKRSLNKTIKP